VIDQYFHGTTSRVGGITLEDIARQADERHSQAFDPLGLETDLTWTVWANIKEEAAERNIATIPEPSIFCSSPLGREIMNV
jgi:glutamate synthase domain-containing protein 2